jgi:hypothetical protein
MRIDASGNVNIGGSADAGNGLRYFDVYSTNTGASAGAIIRLITSNVAASGNTTVDIIKYKNGRFSINNNDINAATYTAFNVGGNDRMVIDSGGRVTLPYQPHVRVICTSGGNLTIATGDQLVPFNYVITQIGSNYNNTATNYKFTCPVSGVYQVSVLCELSGNTALYVNLGIRINGSQQAGTYQAGQNLAYQQISTSASIYCSASDYIQIYLYSNNTSGSLETSAGDSRNLLTITLLG